MALIDLQQLAVTDAVHVAQRYQVQAGGQMAQMQGGAAFRQKDPVLVQFKATADWVSPLTNGHGYLAMQWRMAMSASQPGATRSRALGRCQ